MLVMSIIIIQFDDFEGNLRNENVVVTTTLMILINVSRVKHVTVPNVAKTDGFL
jgi:hypothetical protein